MGHPPLLSYLAIGLGEPREKVRAQMVERMVRPVGKSGVGEEGAGAGAGAHKSSGTDL